jgi:hypothetical protein
MPGACCRLNIPDCFRKVAVCFSEDNGGLGSKNKGELNVRVIIYILVNTAKIVRKNTVGKLTVFKTAIQINKLKSNA